MNGQCTKNTKKMKEATSKELKANMFLPCPPLFHKQGYSHDIPFIRTLKTLISVEYVDCVDLERPRFVTLFQLLLPYGCLSLRYLCLLGLLYALCFKGCVHFFELIFISCWLCCQRALKESRAEITSNPPFCDNVAQVKKARVLFSTL